jgi:hypothetical protein
MKQRIPPISFPSFLFAVGGKSFVQWPLVSEEENPAKELTAANNLLRSVLYISRGGESFAE